MSKAIFLLATAQLSKDPAKQADAEASAQKITWDRSYCSEHMDKRTVEPLSEDDLEKVTRLQQVQAAHRHGARTVASDDNCFGDYWVSMDCTGLKETVGSDYMARSGETSHGTLEMNYDMGGNRYPGTCNTGQLLKIGADMEVANGKNLHSAYVGEDPKQNLWRKAPSLPSDETFFYSTDFMRTRQSLLHTLRGFFGYSGEGIQVSTRHGATDDWTISHDLCPYHSYEYDQSDVKWLDSMESDTGFTKFTANWNETFGVEFGKECWDHVAAASCAGFELPPQLRDEDSQFFKDTMNYGFQRANQLLSQNCAHNHMPGVLADILEKAEPSDGSDQKRLVIWSTHDTTLGTLLSYLGIWDGVYPVYASLLTVEFYEAADRGRKRDDDTSPDLFRITWQGKPITSRLDGCPEDSDLCDYKVFKGIYKGPFEWDSYCQTPIPTCNHKELSGMFYFIASPIGGLIVGAVGMLVFLGIIRLCYNAYYRNKHPAGFDPEFRRRLNLRV